MSSSVASAQQVPWWKEPTKDQWIAWWAAWLGWTLDAFDFTIFLLIMVPIAQEFNVPLTAVTAVFTVTLWLRLVGRTASGWLADRVGRKIPLMISILWYSICNFIAGFSPTFAFLFLFRALARHRHGGRMARRRVAGDGVLAGALARLHERRPARLVGSGLLAVQRGIYGLLYDYIGWRGMLWIGVLPALAVVWVRKYVKEPAVWLENRKKQREQARGARAAVRRSSGARCSATRSPPAGGWPSCMVTYYSIWALFATHLQKDLGLGPLMVARRSRSPTWSGSWRWASGDGSATCLAGDGR